MALDREAIANRSPVEKQLNANAEQSRPPDLFFRRKISLLASPTRLKGLNYAKFSSIQAGGHRKSVAFQQIDPSESSVLTRVF